jgi:hypothetical protein
MEIKYKPKTFTGFDFWDSNGCGVIFVKDEADKQKLFTLLCEQDDYWESYKNLIKILPDISIDDVCNLDKYCEWVGSTDIYDVKALREQVDFLIYQCEN